MFLFLVHAAVKIDFPVASVRVLVCVGLFWIWRRASRLKPISRMRSLGKAGGPTRSLGNVARGSPGNAPSTTLTSFRARARSTRSGLPVSPEDQHDKGGSEKKSGGGQLPSSCACSGLVFFSAHGSRADRRQRVWHLCSQTSSGCVGVILQRDGLCRDLVNLCARIW